MGLFSFLGGGSKKDSGSQDVSQQQQSRTYDPLQAEKSAVASPLSTFLASKVGTGIGEHETDPNYTARYNEYMQVNPVDYFRTNISDPAHEQFNKYAVPLIAEGYAGNLRGSGHYGAQEAGQVGLEENLANTASTFVPQFAKSQIDVGQSEFTRQYNNWFQGLAENNPVLASAINFINSGHTNTDSSSTSYHVPQQSTGSIIGAEGLSSLTAGLGTPTDSGGSGSFTDVLKNPQFWVSIASLLAAGCWVAATVFNGWNDPRTHYARYFIFHLSPSWFQDLYIKHGQDFAEWLSDKPLMKAVIKPMFSLFALIGETHLRLKMSGRLI